MASVLQFWTDEESVSDRDIFGGQVCLTSALAEYVMNTINPRLEEDYKVTWGKIVYWTPWMKKWLLNTDSAGIQKIRRQPIPVEGQSSELEVALENCFNWELQNTEEKIAAKTKLGTQLAPSTPDGSRTSCRLGCSQTLKLHLKKAIQGPSWTHVKPKDQGPDVGKIYEPSQHSESES